MRETTAINKYTKYVRLGREAVKNRNKEKERIIRYALAVCEIKVGGHASSKKQMYSLGKYAADIGMNAGTLREWVRQYEIILSKLPTDIRMDKDGEIIKVIMKGLNRDTPAAEVIKRYNKVKKTGREELTLQKYIRALKTLLSFTRDFNLMEFQDDTRTELKVIAEALHKETKGIA